MGYNFIPCNRVQLFLLPPDMRTWLKEDHLANFVMDTVDQMDLVPFYRSCRADCKGGKRYEPSAMVSQILYEYSLVNVPATG